MPFGERMEDVADKLEPELKEGPMGVPYPKPKGAPDLPGTGD